MDWTISCIAKNFDDRLDAVMRQAAGQLLPGSATLEMLDHLLRQKGKRIRPALVLGTHLAYGGDGESALPLAATVELIHNASLIHDDIEDMDEFRRDQPTAWRLFGVRQAINLGDLLLPAAIFLFLESPFDAPLRVRVLSRISHELMRLVEGQMTEIAGLNREPSGRSEYERVCAGKTGALFRICLTCPAQLVEGPDPTHLAPLDELGTLLGLLFQSRDDLLDITGRKEGRFPLGDLLEGKLSLLTVLAAERLSGPARDEFFSMHRTERPRKDEAMARRMRELLFSQGIVELALESHRRGVERFAEHLRKLPVPGLVCLLEDLLRQLSLDPDPEKHPSI
jgi:geranylgeranyl diphosphate synthase type I